MNFAHHPLLNTLITHDRIGVISDMDGTLSPIVPVPSDAQPTARNRTLLKQLAAQLPLVAVLSGRAVNDLRERVGMLEIVYYGNHGFERWHNHQVEVVPEVSQYLPALQAVFEAANGILLPGMWVENKGATLSIHYRQTENPESSAQYLEPRLQSLADQYQLRLFSGRRVFEIRPPIEIHKGTAFRALVSQYQLNAAVYLGDDTTDVDALRAARNLRETSHCYAVGVGVESPDMPPLVRETADILVSGVTGVEAFLAWLFNAVSAAST